MGALYQLTRSPRHLNQVVSEACQIHWKPCKRSGEAAVRQRPFPAYSPGGGGSIEPFANPVANLPSKRSHSVSRGPLNSSTDQNASELVHGLGIFGMALNELLPHFRRRPEILALLQMASRELYVLSDR
jgi:hypothetical protein